MLTNVDDHRLIRVFFIISGLLVIFHLVNVLLQGPSIHFERLFDLDTESNIPTWFSSFLLALSGLTAYRCSQLSSGHREKTPWMLLATVLLYLSCDEVAGLHETMNLLARKYFSLEWIKGPVWPFILGPVFLTVVVWLAFRLRRDLRGSFRAARLMRLGALLWICGSVVFEASISLLPESLFWVKKIEIVIEESFELIGTIIFLAGLLAHQRFFRENHFGKGFGIKKCQA